MMMAPRPSKPTCPGEIAKATEAAARLIATMIAMPRIWPANTRPREKLRSEKKPTRRKRSSIFVDTKAPVDNKASEKKFTLPPASCARLAVRMSRTIRSGGARPHGGEQAFQGRRDVVAQHRHPAIAFGGDPIELDDPAFAGKGLVPVPGIVSPLERQERPLGRRHLHDHIIEVVSRFQQAQAAAGILPSGVHVNEDGDDLAFRIGMDASIFLAALAPNRRRGRPPGEIEAEFLLEGFAEIAALEFGDELAERRPIGKLRDGKAPALGDLWIVGVDLRARLRPNKAGNDEIFERLPRHRRRLQGFQVKVAQSHGSIPARTDLPPFRSRGLTRQKQSGVTRAALSRRDSDGDILRAADRSS